MAFGAQYITWACATALMACAGARHAPPPAASADRLFITAIAERVRESAGLRVAVDPRPLPDSLEGPGTLPARATPDTGSPYALMRALVQTAVRAAPPRERDHCAGGLVFPDSAGSQHSGCPGEPYVLLVIGTPRRDTAEALKLSRRGRVVHDSHRWVRVLETRFSPGGSTITVSDHVIEPAGSGWRVIRSVELFTFD